MTPSRNKRLNIHLPILVHDEQEAKMFWSENGSKRYGMVSIKTTRVHLQRVLSVSFRQAFHLHVKKEGERGNQKFKKKILFLNFWKLRTKLQEIR